MKQSKTDYLPSHPKFDYLKFPFYWVAQVESLYTHEMEKTLKTMGMDASRWRVSILLHVHENLTISQISQNALMKISTITKIVQRMEKEGLVTVYKHKSDGRVRLVKLTDQGISYVDSIIEITEPMFKDIFSDFSEGEIKTFVQLSQKLFHNLQKSAIHPDTHNSNKS